MKLILIRHGEAENDAPGRIMGQRVDERLNEQGCEQAQRAAEQLPVGVEVVFSSPLLRAKETAEIIARKLNVSLEFRGELKERDYGSLSGKTWDEIRKETDRDLKIIDHNLGYDYQEFGGEHVGQVKTRLLRFINEMKKRYPRKTVVAVTHGGILRLMHHLFPQKERRELGFASIHEFEM